MPNDNCIRFVNVAAHAFPGVYRIEDSKGGHVFVRPVGREAKSRWPHYGFAFWFPADHPDFAYETLRKVKH